MILMHIKFKKYKCKLNLSRLEMLTKVGKILYDIKNIFIKAKDNGQ